MKDGNELWRELELAVNCICMLTGVTRCIFPLVRYCFDLRGGKMEDVHIEWIKFRVGHDDGELDYGPELREESMGKPYFSMVKEIIKQHYKQDFID